MSVQTPLVPGVTPVLRRVAVHWWLEYETTAPFRYVVEALQAGAVHADPELTTQVNVVEPAAFVPSVAVTVTDDVPTAVGVPEISPVDELIANPAGSPVAPYVSVWPEAESDA